MNRDDFHDIVEEHLMRNDPDWHDIIERKEKELLPPFGDIKDFAPERDLVDFLDRSDDPLERPEEDEPERGAAGYLQTPPGIGDVDGYAGPGGRQ